MATLILSQRQTVDNRALEQAALRRGWRVERIQGIRVPEIVGPSVLYLEGVFAPLVARVLRMRLLTPDEGWLLNLPEVYRRPETRLATMTEACSVERASCMQPPSEFEEKGNLPANSGMWQRQFRCFILDGEVRTLSVFMRSGEPVTATDCLATPSELDRARRFAEEVLSDPRVEVPRALALDVGLIEGRGWAVIAAHGAWGAAIHGCDPDAVLDVVRYATVSR